MIGEDLRFGAFVFAIVFLVLGFLGLAETGGLLFGVLHVNTWLCSFYALIGLVGCNVGFMRQNYIRLYFQISGILFTLLAILGFVYVQEDILGLFASTPANTWLHVIAATNALILGYGSND